MSSQLRRDQAQSTYASMPLSATSTTTTTTMYAPIAERAIPYEQYMSRDADHIYSASRVTPRNAPVDATAQELRQFSREPTVISLSSTVDDDPPPAAAATRSSSGGDKPLATAGGAEGACITAGFDSNTLKRMLQSLPEVSTPVDLMHEFEEEFADVVGPSTAGHDSVKILSPRAMPPPPLHDDDHPLPSISSPAPDRPADESSAMSHADPTTSLSEVVTPQSGDVSKEKTEVDHGTAQLANCEQTAAVIPPTDVRVTTLTSSGKMSRFAFCAISS